MKNAFTLVFLLLALISPLSLFSIEEGDSYLKVAFLGTGKKKGEKEELDFESFAKLLKAIKEQKPDLVFFTGNLIMGLEQSTSQASLDTFKKRLDTFSSLAKTHLGENIPIYPVIGNHSIVNSQAVSIFRDHFKLKNDVPLESSQFAYSVVIDHVKFSVLATGDYERKFRGYRQFHRSMPIIDWLEKDLRTGTDGINFRFVINHEPAYSSGASEGVYTGLDKDFKRRDMLWKILKENKVRGYFCSHELIYDRSNRGGVWQIVSGGIENPENIEKGTPFFQNFVMMQIPKNKEENPVVKAFDLSGKVWDKFELMPIDRPVHHLRISLN